MGPRRDGACRSSISGTTSRRTAGWTGRAADPKAHTPVASLAARLEVPPNATREVTFLLAWHFPNRYTWTPAAQAAGVGARPIASATHYTTRYTDAWDVLAREVRASRRAPRRGRCAS